MRKKRDRPLTYNEHQYKRRRSENRYLAKKALKRAQEPFKDKDTVQTELEKR